MRLDPEREVAQDLRPEPVAQAHILESDHVLASEPHPRVRASIPAVCL